MDTLQFHEVPAVAAQRGALPAFGDRLHSLAWRASIVTGTMNGDQTRLGFTAMRVARQWPLRGSVTLTREDGKRFRLALIGKRWTVKELH